MKFAPGTVLVMGSRLQRLRLVCGTDRPQGVFFVTRMKDNADYGVVEKRKTPEKSNVVSDEVMFFYSMAKAGKEHVFRRIEIWDEEQQKALVFLTNHLEFGYDDDCRHLYKDRWKVELFFKAIKQNLKIKTFLGTSANAVHTPNLDGIDCDAIVAVPAIEGHLRLVVVQFGGSLAPSIVCVSRPV
jgi:hypothetical protein